MKLEEKWNSFSLRIIYMLYRYDGLLQHDSHPDQTTRDGCPGKQQSRPPVNACSEIVSVKILFLAKLNNLIHIFWEWTGNTQTCLIHLVHKLRKCYFKSERFSFVLIVKTSTSTLKTCCFSSIEKLNFKPVWTLHSVCPYFPTQWRKNKTERSGSAHTHGPLLWAHTGLRCEDYF